jgi:hypothetical protein
MPAVFAITETVSQDALLARLAEGQPASGAEPLRVIADFGRCLLARMALIRDRSGDLSSALVPALV